MANDDKINDVGEILSLLKKEEEIIIKTFHSQITHELEALEYGKVVSRLNKTLFEYKIDNPVNSCLISAIFNRRIVLIHPETKQVLFELYDTRLPFLFKISYKQVIRSLYRLSNENHSIGSIQQKLAFTKTCYNIYNNKRQPVISLVLRRSYLVDKIQHRISEFKILDHNKKINIGRIYPYSTNFERTQYGQAIAIQIPQDMKVEIKATLLIATLILKSRLN